MNEDNTLVINPNESYKFDVNPVLTKYLKQIKKIKGNLGLISEHINRTGETFFSANSDAQRIYIKNSIDYSDLNSYLGSPFTGFGDLRFNLNDLFEKINVDTQLDNDRTSVLNSKGIEVLKVSKYNKFDTPEKVMEENQKRIILTLNSVIKRIEMNLHLIKGADAFRFSKLELISLEKPKPTKKKELLSLFKSEKGFNKSNEKKCLLSTISYYKLKGEL